MHKNTSIVVTRLGVATEPYTKEDGTQIFFAKISYTPENKEEPVIRYVDNSIFSTEPPANPDGDIVFEENNDVLKVIAEVSISLRKTAIWINGDDEHNAAQVVGHAYNGNTLQATHKGVESDGTVWYKVIFEGNTYYVIYKSSLLEIQTPAAQ